jgi:hypothetical protein
MAKNTGRGTRAGAITGRVRELPSPQWVDINSREWVVWHEGGEVIVYEGEREVATRSPGDDVERGADHGEPAARRRRRGGCPCRVARALSTAPLAIRWRGCLRVGVAVGCTIDNDTGGRHVGMIRKMTSVSTLGAVSFQAPREKQARAAMIQAKAARTEAKALKKMAKDK